MNLIKEAHFTPPEEEAELMCAMRRETVSLSIQQDSCLQKL